MEMLSFRGICKRFGEKQVLRGLDLTVGAGSIYGFIGKNGAGKTTAMKLALGLLRPDAGEILVCGERVRYGETRTNRFIGYLPDVPAFDPQLTAPEYLRFCGEISGMERREIAPRSEELLRLVGLWGERHRISGYSRGMKQRLGIAQALLNRPALLICDEPTSALDVVGRREILEILTAVREQTTVLLSTHILSDVERICTDVAFLDRGSILLQGPLSEIRARYRRDSFEIDFADAHAAAELLSVFPQMKRSGENPLRLTFSEGDCAPASVLSCLGERGITPLRFERTEPTLESLFWEVSGV